MKYTKIRLFTANGIPEALSNLWYGNNCTVTKITDAVEDAVDGADLLQRLRGMKLSGRFHLDRENKSKVRFEIKDCWGNISHLEVCK